MLFLSKLWNELVWDWSLLRLFIKKWVKRILIIQLILSIFVYWLAGFPLTKSLVLENTERAAADLHEQRDVLSSPWAWISFGPWNIFILKHIDGSIQEITINLND